MTGRMVYLILAERGQYSDFEYRLLSVWDTREQAEAEVARLKETLPKGEYDWDAQWNFDIDERPVNVGLGWNDC